jgi:hypothetical protein
MTTPCTPVARPLHRRFRSGSGLLGRLRVRWAEQRHCEEEFRLESALRGTWREACIGVGLCHYMAVPTGLTVKTPRFGGLRVIGQRITFTVELLPGQEPEDIAARAGRLAHTLGAQDLGVEPVAARWVRIVLTGGPAI